MKKLAHHIVGLGLLAASVFAAADSHAYILANYKWPGSKPRVPVYVSNGLQGHIPYDGTFDQAIIAIQNAINEWNTAGAAETKIFYAGTTDVNTVANDGINTIIYSNSQCPYGGGCVAYAGVHHANGTIKGFDLVFYRYKGNTGAQLNWSIKTSPYPSDSDLWTVVLHELGHGIGINHSNYSSVVMSPTGCGVGCAIRHLYNDDKNAIRAAYGNYTNEGFWPNTTNPAWGQTVTLSIDYPQAPNQQYAILASTTPGTFPLRQTAPQDSRILQIDGNYFPTENYPAVFINFDGTLNANGQATATINLPAAGFAAAGRHLYLTAVTFNCQYLNCYEDVGVGVTLNLPAMPQIYPVATAVTDAVAVTELEPWP